MQLTGDGNGRVLTGEEIVISGMSGHFPSSENVTEFMENLFKKIDMVVEVESEVVNPELPRHRGKISEPGKFDAQFFKVTYKQAMSFEPMCRKLIENAYGAIYDSGLNPLEMSGKKLGVFIGSSYADGSQASVYQVDKYYNQFFITGYGKTMYANRISYWINSRSPSYSVECACAGSLACLHIAYDSILSGECEAALIGGCSLCLSTNLAINIKRAGFTCTDGKTKCFDKYGDGYVRSDTIGALFLQKAKHAKRIYAEVYHTKLGYIRNSEDHRGGCLESMKTFLKTFYSETDVPPEAVEYVEANGVGIAEVDKNELEAIGEIFTSKGNFVKIGSVKSNMGNSEPASGIAALTKVCLAYHRGEIPANLHYNYPIDDVDATRDGRLEVVQENSSFKRGFVAINNFSATGASVHALLKGYYKEKNFERYRTNIPYLVNVSGRNEDCVERLLDILGKVPVDAEYIGLIHNIYQISTAGHMCRGYAIIGSEPSEEVQVISKNFDYYRGVQPPVCFMFSGMGSQWVGMGTDLMRIPIFAAAVKKCHNILVTKGVDLINILTSDDKTIFDNVMNSFVGITAVQIGLVDILHALEIRPDYIIGHSTGEMGCAYADGCLSLEETILCAYARGVVSTRTKFAPGAMAAVGLGYNNMKRLCPPEIDVACHNSPESSTISGPADILREFVGTLKSRGVFAKEVACGNIAFHSRYITSAGPALLETLQEIIKDPRPRTSKWMSTSFTQTKWNEDVAKYSSAEYHTNNLLSPVYFEETSKLIPSDAVIIEVAPHGLLQAIMKRSHRTCVNVPLARRDHLNPVKFLLESIGSLYQNGLNPKIDALYPEIEFPVATGTPMLSNLIGWEHSEDWPVDESKPMIRVHSQMNYYIVSLYDDDFKFLDGYTRNGINVVPEALYLVLAWKTLAMSRNVNHGLLPVKFSDVNFHDDVSFGSNKFVKLKISINKGDHKFEITHEDKIIVNGYISDQLDSVKYSLHEKESSGDGDVVLNSEEIYTMMNLKGYNFNKEFQSVRSVSLGMDKAKVDWTGEWVTYLDALFQLNVIRRNYEGVSKPKLIEKLMIDVKKQNVGRENGENMHNAHDVQIFKFCDTIRCGGVTIKNTVFCDIPVAQSVPDVLLTKQFWPHFLEHSVLNLETALQIQMQIVAENTTKSNINVTEFHSTTQNSDLIENVVKFIPSYDFNWVNVQCCDLQECLEKHKAGPKKADILIMYDVVQRGQSLNSIHDAISDGTFVIIRESKQYSKTLLNKFCIVSAIGVSNGKLLILMKKYEHEVDGIEDFNVIDASDDRQCDNFDDCRETTDTRKQSIILYCYKRGSNLDKLKLAKIRNSQAKANTVIIEDEEAPEFTTKSLCYRKQLKKNLKINTYKQGQWGGYYSTPASPFVHDHNYKLVMEIPHDLKTLKWSQVSFTKSSSTRTVDVCYSGLSQRDCQQPIFETACSGIGMDFSGIDSNGDYVMGLVPEGAVSTVLNPDPDLLWPVPKHWTLQEAATVPLPYVHAYYILNKFYITNKMRVLIIGGAGALGQALISICLSLGSTVYTTVSTQRKKKTLLGLFPNLDENNVICGKTPEMVHEHIVTATKNECCHYAISCADGKLRDHAMNCVGVMGVFIDVNRNNIELDKTFGFHYLLKFRSVKAMNLSNIFENICADEKKIIKHKIAEGIAAGVVKPLSAITFNTDEVPKAFGLLSGKKHIGRVLIRMRSNQMPMSVSPRITCSPEAIFVVVCSECVLSLQVIEFLISRGARKFMIIWNGTVTGSLIYKLQCWQKIHVTLNLVTINCITENDCFDVLKQVEDLDSIQGIFLIHGKVADDCKVAKDHRLLQEYNEYLSTISSFDSTSRRICKQLEYFVVVSGCSQNIYDENLYLEAEKICESRYNDNLPGVAFKTDALNESCKSSHQPNQYIEGNRMKTALTALEISLKLNYYNIQAVTVKNCLNDPDATEHNGTDNIPYNKLQNTDHNGMKVEIENVAFKKERNATQNGVVSITANSDARLKGLGNFFSHIENDVYEFIRDPIVMMSTKLYPYFEESMEMDANAMHLLLIPGFEGHHRIFKTMCESIKIRAVAVHLDTDVNSYSITEMASTILKSLANKLKMNGKFYLLGYSFGVDIALEIASLLERDGHQGIVYCLDSSPDTLRLQMEACIGDLSNVNLQNTVIAHMFPLISGFNCEEFNQEIETTDSWYKKIDIFIKRVKGLVPYSQEYMRLLIETTYNKLVLGRDYRPTYKLNSQLVLVKAKSTLSELNEDYDLGKYSRQTVKIYNVNSDNASVPLDARVPSIINGLLDKKLLDEFDNTNTCEIYLTQV